MVPPKRQVQFWPDIVYIQPVIDFWPIVFRDNGERSQTYRPKNQQSHNLLKINDAGVAELVDAVDSKYI